MNLREIRADFDKESITVYQAYNKYIALPAIKDQKFSTSFSFDRMTWIKPSFLWMMERSNWGSKSNQEYILGIKIKRECWAKALKLAVLTHPDSSVYKDNEEWRTTFNASKVHVQWDPERSFRGKKLQFKSIQVGISRHLIEEYNNEWIVSITDYTQRVKKIRRLRDEGKIKEAKRLLPKESRYLVSEEIMKRIGITETSGNKERRTK